MHNDDKTAVNLDSIDRHRVAGCIVEHLIKVGFVSGQAAGDQLI